jgi:hypothetical protein
MIIKNKEKRKSGLDEGWMRVELTLIKFNSIIKKVHISENKKN